MNNLTRRTLSAALFTLSLLATSLSYAGASAQLQALQAGGAGPFSAAAGEALWLQDNNGRSCASCHGRDPSQPGKHQKTGKPIEPMTVHANPERFTDAAKTEKWFLRNCRWTLGRECSAQEKGDVITWLSQP
jgi:mono/diheme cytochrome c family protein